MKLKTALIGATAGMGVLIGSMQLTAESPDLESIKSATTVQSQNVDYGNVASNVCVDTHMERTKVLGSLGEYASRTNAEKACGVKNKSPMP